MQTIDPIVLSVAENLPKRANELILVFLRFEFALKELGYGVAGRSGEASANWDKYSNDKLSQKFFNRICEKAISPTLLEKPPSKQVLTRDGLDWQDGIIPVSVQDLLGAVRRVRNNLAHGGKSGDPDHDHNELLVSDALNVLFEILRVDDVLRTIFEGKY